LEEQVDRLLIIADSDKFVFRQAGLYASLTCIEPINRFQLAVN
jgi:hypothetical protein